MLRPNTLFSVASMMRVVASASWRHSGSKLPHLANRGLPCEPNPPIRQSRLTSTDIPAVLAAFTAVCMAQALAEAPSARSRALTLTAPPRGYRLIRWALHSLGRPAFRIAEPHCGLVLLHAVGYRARVLTGRRGMRAAAYEYGAPL